jgi:MinD-like ATPase involved in chromosome partitioning or flagellar assembly
MAAMLEDIKREYHSKTVILDLPPILSGDDVIAILPQMDCVLLVTAVGTTTVAQIKECNKHLQSAEVVRIVVNKVPETSTNYHYY